MIDQTVPASMVAVCCYCAAQIDTRDSRHYQRIKGWALNRNKGNSVTLGQRSAIWACHECIDKLKHGVPTGQQSLFVLAEDD